MPQLYAQCTTPPNCIFNPGIDGSSVGWGNAIGTSLSNWHVLSGTPTLAQGMGSSSGFRLQNGDGMYTCFNFVAGRKYKVCIYSYTTNGTIGTLKLEAHNGSSGQSPGTIFVTKTSHPPAPYSTVVFTATSNFSQLRLLVNTSGTSVVIDDVGVIEVPTVTVSQSTISGCGSTTLTASSNNSLNISWSPSDGLSSTSGNSVTASPCSTTTYTATYTTGCSPIFSCNNSGENTVQVTVNVNPGTTVTASPSIVNWCQSTTLTATSANNMGVTWSPAIGLSSSYGKVVTANPCTTTTYTASFYCPLSNCTYTKDVTVYVQPSGSILNNSDQECGGVIDMEYTGSQCQNFTYKWVHMDNPNTVLFTGRHYYKGTSGQGEDGLYRLTVTSPMGCSETYYTTVSKNCCKIVADFEIIGCNPVRFENTTVDSIGGDTLLVGEWHWDFGDGMTSSLRNPAHLYYTHMGPTKVCLTAVVADADQSTCCSKVCKEFDVCDFIGCVGMGAFAFKLINPATGEVQLYDKSAGNSPDSVGHPPHLDICRWEWMIDGNPLPNTNDPNPIVTGLHPGTIHDVCLKVVHCNRNCSTRYPGGPCVPYTIECPDEWRCEKIVIPQP